MLETENLVVFCRTLREHGMSVTPAEVVTAAAALQIIDTKDRDEVFLSLRSILTTSVEDFPIFESLFATFWSRLPKKSIQRENVQIRRTSPARATGGVAFFLENWPASNAQS